MSKTLNPCYTSGYGYDEVKCKDVEQETCYNAPELVEEIQPVTNTVPEAEEVSQHKPVLCTVSVQ